MGKCPLCGEYTNRPNTRLIKESCGHSKCRICLINEESGCSICDGNNGEISCRLESIGNFDYHIPATLTPNYEQLHSTPRKLDFNKIPDDFIDCPLDVGKLTIDNSINQSLDNVEANIPGPEKVDIGTETEIIVPDKDVQSQTVQENTHSSLSEVMQTPMQPITKVSEVFANTANNNHQPHQETPVVQNTNFIPVTQRVDGRQFITIAFIANNSPNKNQQVVAPLLNQCLPTLTNVTAVQRAGGNQCIPMLGNISALQNGNQFIIRSPNIVQNLVGNQSIPVIGNLNTMQNLPGNQSLSIVGNVNAIKNLVANQSLPPLATINPLPSSTKGQSLPTTISPNAVQKVIENHSHQVTQVVPKEVEEQSAPIQENANTARRQIRTRGLPRIKTVKNVNIVQKSATNQSDKVNSQIDKRPVQAGKGKRKRKELPVYLIPRKQNEQKKSPPVKSPPPPPQVIGSMSPEFKLKDFLFFKGPQNASQAKDSEIQTETINDTQMINKPSESVINETRIVSDQFNATVIDDEIIENKVDITEQEDKVPNDKTNDEKSKDISIETDECKEHQDLSVIFNITDENKQTLPQKVEDEKEKDKIPNGEASNKDEYQNLDALFDIIEKESKKLNGGMFDKEEKLDLDEENSFHSKENQKLYDKMDNEKDASHMLNQEDNIEGEKDENLNNGIDDEHEDQHLNLDMDSQNKDIENLNEELCCIKEENSNLHENNYHQEQNLIEELPIQNGAVELEFGEVGCKEEKYHNLNTETKDHHEDSEIFGNFIENHEVGNEEEIQSFDEKIVGVEKESENQMNEDASLQEENDQHFDEGMMTKEVDSNENDVNDDKNNSKSTNEKTVNEEKGNQTLYEDISDEEKDSEDLNNKNQELQTPTAENNEEKVNYEELNENTVEEESQISSRKAVNQDEESNLSLTIEMNEEIIESAPSDTNNDLPICDTNISDNSTLDATSQQDETIIVKKSRGRPKKSLHNYEQECKSEISHENEQSIVVRKDSENLNTEVDGNEGDESFVLETHIGEDDEIMHENVNTNLTLVEMNKSEDEKPDTTTENAQSIVIKQRRGRKKKSFSDYEFDRKPESNKNEQSLVKKPRGRPKKSLSNIEQPNKPNGTQEIEEPADRKLPSFSIKCYNHEDNLDQSFEEEGQVLEVNVQIHNQEIYKDSILNIDDKKESINSDSTSNSASVIKKPRGRPKIQNVLHNPERENLQPDVDAISTFVEEDETPVQKPDTVNGNEHSTAIKKSRGRPKKSMSTSEQPSQSDLSNVNVELTVVKKPRGRPKKSLTNSEQHNESNVSQETEISNVHELINNEESKEQHERDEGAESQVLDKEDFRQDETSQDSRVHIDAGEKESLHTNVTANLTSSDKGDSDVRKSIIGNGNEPSIVTKKPRGRPKKSLSILEQQIEPQVSDINIEPIVVKKLKGRPKKSLSNVEAPNDCDVSQETEISNVREAINGEESKGQRERGESGENQVLDKENVIQYETLQDSIVNMDDAEKESPHSNDVTNSTSSNINESDAKKTVNESSIVIKKPKGRPKKSLTSNEQPNQPDESISDISVEPTVKKARGRPKKSLSIFEQQNQLVSQETELSNTIENSSWSDKINDEEGKEQHKAQENQDLNRKDFETSQHSIVNMNDGEKESFHSDLIASSTSDESHDKALHTVNEKEQVTVIKQPMGRPNKSLSSSSEQQKDLIVSDVDAQVVVKKSRGRPKKSLPNLEQPNMPMNSELDGEDNREKDQAQCLNGTIDKEEIKRPEVEKDSHDVTIQSLSTSLHTEDDESSILETEVNKSSNQNSVDDKLDITRQSEQITVVKKSRGRPKKSKPQGPIEKRPRGRPKKANYEQQTESKLPSFFVDYSEKKDEQQSLDGNVVDDDSRALDSEDNDREESSQTETPNEENKSSVNEYERERIDDQEEGNDLVPNEDTSDKINSVATLSDESDENQTKQQNCNEVSDDEGENQVSQKDVEEKDIQHLKAQDDENKENKKEYSEKEEARIETITPVTEEQDLEKSNKVDDEVPQNNTTGRKYKKFDAINAQVIVGSSKRKRKPKVLLYENEDLDITPLKKKKKNEFNKSPCTNESKTTDKKSLEKTQVNSSTHTNESKENAESTEITVKNLNVKNQLQENEKTASIDQLELIQYVSLSNENSMDTETSETNISTTASSSKDEDTKSMKRNRRPKTLLYENEDLKIKRKNLKKKKVEFLLPEDSVDSYNTEKDDKLEVFTNDDELPTIAKKSDRVRKPKTLLYENERFSFAFVKEKDIKSEIEKEEDLMFMKKFEIKLEPIVVLERNIDLTIIKKYDLDDKSLHIVDEKQDTTHSKKPNSKVDVKKPRGRPKLSNESTASKNKITNSKVLVSKHKKLILNNEKRRPGRPSKQCSHITQLPGEPPTYQCSICLKSFKHYTSKALHLDCGKRARNSTIKTYKCEFCPRKFYQKSHLQYHVNLHKGDKPFQCNLCGKDFIQKSKLNRHLLIHKYTQNLECNECGKKFASKDYLKSHLLSHVKSSFVFRCNQCPKSFAIDSSRKRHELSHSPVALFKCLHCPKSFKTKFEVNKHTKIHQKARPFACDQCGKAFLTKFEVKRHYIAHTGEKKYTCSYCQQQFGRIDNYSRHMLHHHSVNEMAHKDFLTENTYNSTPGVRPERPTIEEKKQEKKKDKSAVKPKKISRTSSNPVPVPISFIQPLTPQSVPSPYSISQNHELASVIHETLPDLNNAVPVINAPISAQPSLSLMDTIPLEQALVLNRQIEEKIYTQNSFCEFPGLTRRVNVTVVNHSQSFDIARRDSSESNSNSNDGTSFMTMNKEQTTEEQDDNKINKTSPIKKDIHVHWRRRTAETFKSKIDQNK